MSLGMLSIFILNINFNLQLWKITGENDMVFIPLIYYDNLKTVLYHEMKNASAFKIPPIYNVR